jgi:hypothetical protein
LACGPRFHNHVRRLIHFGADHAQRIVLFQPTSQRSRPSVELATCTKARLIVMAALLLQTLPVSKFDGFNAGLRVLRPEPLEHAPKGFARIERDVLAAALAVRHTHNPHEVGWVEQFLCHYY